MRVTQLAMMIGLVAACAAGVETYTWDAGGDGISWTDAANWNLDSGYPGNNTHAAVITNGNAAITVPAGTTLGALTLDVAYTGTVSLAGSLVIDAAGGASGNLAVNSGTLRTGKDVESGITVAGTLSIASNATVVARRRNTTGGGAGQMIRVSVLEIALGGTLHADREGFDAGLNKGPGGPSHTYDGASHGGTGGDNAAYGLFRDTYGSFTNPVALGSGANGSAGGGAVIVEATFSATVDGTIGADGGISTTGAGSGGSINLKTPILAGTGTIRARGGNTTDTGGLRGTGGGGRIAFLGVTSDTFSGVIQVHAGTGGSHPGRPGTVWLSDPLRQNLYLGAGGMTNLLLGFDGTNAYSFGTVVIASNATLEIDAYENGSPARARIGTLTVRSLDVRTNGLLAATGRGFRPMFGPGKPLDNYDGAAHGGTGGHSLGEGNVMPETCGSFTNPVWLGSGSESRGGGALVIRASSQVTVNGTLAAESFASLNHASGAGGSINITTPSLAGTGVISARSGDARRGPGGGGRIAFHGVSNDAFIGQILVNPGGTLEGMDGRSGTLWLSEPRRQNLYIGEGGIASLQLGSDGTNDYTFGSVVIGPNGSLAIDSYVRTVIIGNAGATAAVGRVATLYLDTLDVQTTGTLTAKGNGFIDMFTKWSYPAWGPGFAWNSNHGASHGGMGGYGGVVAGALAPPYGSITGPATLGSGATSDGGGAVVIVGNAVNVDGLITADGDASVNLGGGSGGSVRITAGTLSGAGEISARGGARRTTQPGKGSGGGGRISVRLTESADTGSVRFYAHGGNLSNYGAAGTLYVRAFEDSETGGRVVYDNNGYATLTNSFSVFPGEDDLPKARVVVTNAGTRVNLSADARCQELTLDAGVVFNLNGRTLQTDRLTIDGTRYPANTYPASALPSEVIDAEAGMGRIVVLGNRAGTMILVR
jgi:hypothetical protein